MRVEISKVEFFITFVRMNAYYVVPKLQMFQKGYESITQLFLKRSAKSATLFVIWNWGFFGSFLHYYKRSTVCIFTFTLLELKRKWFC